MSMQGVRMPTEALVRRRMPLEDYLGLSDDVRAEYVDGVAIVTPRASMPHNEVGARMLMLLRASLSGVHVGFEMGLHLPDDSRRIPDIAVVDRLEDTLFTRQIPHLVVEVLSPSTRSEDTLRKSVDYQRAGIGQYWIVDRDNRAVVVHGNTGVGWELLLELDAGRPRGEVAVAEYGVVVLDRDELLSL